MFTEVVVFRVVTPYSDMVGYQRLRGPCCLHVQGEDVDSTVSQLKDHDLNLYRHENPKSRNIYAPLVIVTAIASNLYVTNGQTAWNRVLDKLIVAQLVKFLVFNGTRRFITVYIRARHWFLS